MLENIHELQSASEIILFHMYPQHKLVEMLSACLCVYLDVNQVGTNRNRCTQRLVILQAQTY